MVVKWVHLGTKVALMKIKMDDYMKQKNYKELQIKRLVETNEKGQA